MRKPRRSSARCLVLDSENRVLLLEWVDPLDGISVWLTPGGGIEDGETAQEAARRELLEEVGIAVTGVGPCVMRQVVEARTVIRVEQHFLVRDGAAAKRGDAADPGTRGHRWWSLAELEVSDNHFHPRNLAVLLRHVLEMGDDEGPLDEGWDEVSRIQ